MRITENLQLQDLSSGSVYSPLGAGIASHENSPVRQGSPSASAQPCQANFAEKKQGLAHRLCRPDLDKGGKEDSRPEEAANS